MHVPFCDVRCPYCHFTCFVNRDAGLFDRWADGVVAQFDRMRSHFGVRRIVSAYFGGGTPTALPPTARATITDWLAGVVGPLLEPGAEVTIECNPESTWPETLAPWVDGGVNRISLGLQSMDPGVLAFLGRLNTPASNRRALDLACRLVDNVSADLIVGTPPDSPATMRASLDEILAWPVRHVSAYLLEIHAATRFGRDLESGRLVPVPDDEQAATYRGLVAHLDRAGLVAYELSNFARPGFEARHNRRYWTLRPYLGIGPSAHSHVARWRWAEQRDTARWWAAVDRGQRIVEDVEEIGPSEAQDERILLGLRLREGVEESLLADRARLVEEFVRGGLLAKADGRVAATVDGWLLLDQIVARLRS